MNWLRSPGTQIRSLLPNLRCGSQQSKPILGQDPTCLVPVQMNNVSEDVLIYNTKARVLGHFGIRFREADNQR